MLGQIAFNTFVNGEYFFRQEDLQRQIKDYICNCNLPGASADPDALRLDSEVVLKAIEHHHGLLVERARNIYSFSHLTFQEYFASREIERERHFENLIENISNPRWKEVFYLTAEMLRRSDDFLKMMKDRIDGMLANDKKLQALLEWLNQKTNSAQFSYKTVSVRVFYAYAGLYALNYSWIMADDSYYVMNYELASTVDFDCIFRERVDISYHVALNNMIKFIQYLDPLFVSDLEIAKNVGSKESINLYYSFPKQVWNPDRNVLSEELSSIGEKHYKDRQFTEEEIELLNQYYEANLLLVECMNRSYVSKQVREEIEATMLLPVGS